ncbi:hypothetical protein GLP40_15650 [Nocardia sp. CT2-14]|uniref:Uncharacterized protein n=2 Tax=Nocardia aurantiaca TaxID=2675850 RepID=A0A6I3KTR3_9NOCA|nr:hypothetical protein [Nocardia aurantiaca]
MTMWLSVWNEAVWLQLTPDTTAAEVSAFWSAVEAGDKPARNILLSQPVGTGPLELGGQTGSVPPGSMW